jgi:serine/threonine-protein phosphatase 2B catalytic subunit
MALLMALKVNFIFIIQLNYPKGVFCLRGNHESRNMTEHFTFREEAITKFDEDTYEMFMDLFDAMPLSATVENKYFVIHGGIGPELKKIDAINKIDRF